MKKLFTVLFAALVIVFAGGVVAAPAANAASPSVSVTTEASVASVAQAAVPKAIGGGVVKPAYLWLPSSYCYWSGITSWNYYCYRYACTTFEKVVWGCYNGYVRMTTYSSV